MAISDFKIGEYYISKKLEIHKCVHVPGAISSSYKFVDINHNVKSLYDLRENALKKYLRHHEFNKTPPYNFHANNQSITEFFDLIIHLNSNLSKNSISNFKLNICSPNDSMSIDYNDDKFKISVDKDDTAILLIENIKYERAKPINDKILRLKQYLGLYK